MQLSLPPLFATTILVSVFGVVVAAISAVTHVGKATFSAVIDSAFLHGALEALATVRNDIIIAIGQGHSGQTRGECFKCSMNDLYRYMRRDYTEKPYQPS
ncbi:hypothetical protein BD410DRAFT_832261 [Rickenella mellea]|uniref:Uncharacterized protein n=1 Tax=Rickenella mellea TaxID=50990 RepID=A0A4Y7PNM6_9AGAM|nr:hypothetical protein BD410DRAFT_832261 [Rickenella mellea]